MENTQSLLPSSLLAWRCPEQTAPSPPPPLSANTLLNGVLRSQGPAWLLGSSLALLGACDYPSLRGAGSGLGPQPPQPAKHRCL